LYYEAAECENFPSYWANGGQKQAFYARVADWEGKGDLKSSAREGVRVRLPPSAYLTVGTVPGPHFLGAFLFSAPMRRL
jgi:hypothetical protein